MKDILDNDKYKIKKTIPKKTLPIKSWNPHKIYKCNWHELHQINYSIRSDFFKEPFDVIIFKMWYDKDHASPNSRLDNQD